MVSIESLSSEIARLGTSLEFWKTCRLFVVAGTVLLALATMVAQWMEMRLSGELAAVQKVLIRFKDEQLRGELADKDVRIADANRAAGEANAEVARAGKAAGEANERAEVAAERAARFVKEAEELRHRNLEMQASLTPRILVWSDFVHERLKRFAGTRWDLRVPAGDLEARDFGDLIGKTLQMDGWPFGTGGTVHGERFDEGVVVSVAKASPLWKAGAELVSYIKANRAEATLQDDDSAPKDWVAIKVGSKPRSALLTPVLKEGERIMLVERDNKKGEEMERFRKEWRLPPYDK